MRSPVPFPRVLYGLIHINVRFTSGRWQHAETPTGVSMDSLFDFSKTLLEFGEPTAAERGPTYEAPDGRLCAENTREYYANIDTAIPRDDTPDF